MNGKIQLQEIVTYLAVLSIVFLFLSCSEWTMYAPSGLYKEFPEGMLIYLEFDDLFLCWRSLDVEPSVDTIE